MCKVRNVRKLDIRKTLPALVCISILLIVGGCDREHNDNMTKRNDIDKSNIVKPERIYIKVTRSANYEDDFKNSVKRGDLRFVGLMGYALSVPGVPDFEEKYSRSNGVKIIEGTSDSYNNTAELLENEFYEEYAKRYNALLLEYLAASVRNK